MGASDNPSDAAYVSDFAGIFGHRRLASGDNAVAMGLKIEAVNATDVRAIDAGAGLSADDQRDVLDASARVSPAAVDRTLEEAGLISADGVDVTVAPEYAQAKAGTHVFMRGHRGDGVEDMQERLIAVGAMDPEAGPAHGADGIFGRNTEAAVRSFQETHGLAVDGMAGPETLTKLDEMYEARIARRGEDAAPVDAAERAERREEVVETAVEALGGPAVSVESPGALVAPTVDDAGIDVGDADSTIDRLDPPPTLAQVDPDDMAHPSIVHEAMRDVITAEDGDRTEKAVEAALGGPEGVIDRMDQVVLNAPLPNFQRAAADLEAQATITHVGGADAVAGTPEQGATDAAQLRELAGMYLFKRTQPRPNLVEDKLAINDLVADRSPSQLDAIVAADPTLGADLVRTFRQWDPEYAQTLGRMFGSEEAVDEWMHYGPVPTYAEMMSGQTKQW